LDALTYPHQAVTAAISELFIPVQIDTQDGSQMTTETVKRFRQVWTPDLRMIDHEGVELYRWNGYLPPAEFLPQLLAGRAQGLLRSEGGKEASEAYAEVLRKFPTSFVAPEAAYFRLYSDKL
jgi:thioredoxin-related protein